MSIRITTDRRDPDPLRAALVDALILMALTDKRHVAVSFNLQEFFLCYQLMDDERVVAILRQFAEDARLALRQADGLL